MITEDYVSFETAKLLKEKGFDEGCSFVVNTISKGVMPVSWPTTNSEIEDEKANLIALPTLQMAMKWIREKGFHIYSPMEIDFDEDETGNKGYHDAAYYPEIRRVSDGRIMYDDDALYATPEQACETAIKYYLENLI